MQKTFILDFPVDCETGTEHQVIEVSHPVGTNASARESIVDLWNNRPRNNQPIEELISILMNQGFEVNIIPMSKKSILTLHVD